MDCSSATISVIRHRKNEDYFSKNTFHSRSHLRVQPLSSCTYSYLRLDNKMFSPRHINNLCIYIIHNNKVKVHKWNGRRKGHHALKVFNKNQWNSSANCLLIIFHFGTKVLESGLFHFRVFPDSRKRLTTSVFVVVSGEI